MFCRRARCESGVSYWRRPKQSGTREFPEFRAYLKKGMGIDAKDWSGIDEADAKFLASGVLVSFHLGGQRAALFVVTDTVAEELATLSRRQKESGQKIHHGDYLQFVVGNTNFLLSEGYRTRVERRQGGMRGEFMEQVTGSTQTLPPINQEAVMAFFHQLKTHCASIPDEDNCPRCCMRMFCMAAPKGLHDNMVMDAIRYLDMEQGHPPAPQTDKRDWLQTPHRNDTGESAGNGT